MRGRPLVSVIVPAYNAERYIADALASVLGQTCQDVEIIVVDDGSTDATADIVGTVAAGDPRVRLVEQPNGGVARARNSALALARGEFVAPLDADDLWYPDKLRAQVTRFHESGSPLGMVYSWWVGIDRSGRIRGSSFPTRVEGDLFLDLVFTNFLCASGSLIKRSVLLDVGGWDPSLRERGGEGCEDWDLWLRIADRCHVGCAPGFYTAYRQTPAGMSTNTVAMERSYQMVVERARELRDIPEPVLRWSRGAFYGYLSSTSYSGGGYLETVRHLAQMVLSDPVYLGTRHFVRLSTKSVALATAVALAQLGVPGLRRWLQRRLRRSRNKVPTYTLEVVEHNWAEETRPVPWIGQRRVFGKVQERRWRRLHPQDRVEPLQALTSLPLFGDACPSELPASFE